MKKGIILIFLAFAGFFSSIYLFILEKELLFLFSAFYHLSFSILISAYLYLKKILFLRNSLIISLIGVVIFLIKGHVFLSLLSSLFFLLIIYLILETPRGKVVRYPNSVLRKKADRVAVFEIDDLLEEMIEIVKEEDGAGLAAPQIGISKRVIIARLGEDIFTLINPKITFIGSEKVISNEGCLSLKGIWVDIERHAEIMVEFYNKEGENVIMEVSGILSIIIQHEADHLDGVLIIDYLPFREKMKSLVKYYFKEYLW